MMVTCYLALGSNLGDRLGFFNQAKKLLSPHVTILEESGVYETEPWGYLDQPTFLNQVIKVDTELGPLELLRHNKNIEKLLGREIIIQNGPRVIDVDILFYADRVISLPDLSIPHPAIPERAFVLVPLAEIAPCLVHPVLHTTVREMLSRVDRAGVHLYQEMDGKQ